MASAIQLVHDEDPREVMRRDLRPFLDTVRFVVGADVLIGVYVKPDAKTRGGIIMPDRKRDDDKYQGKVGMILATGALAFQDDERHRWGDQKPQIGDWVVFEVTETLAFDTVNDRRIRIVEDIHVRVVIDDPDMVWSLSSVGSGYS